MREELASRYAVIESPHDPETFRQALEAEVRRRLDRKGGPLQLLRAFPEGFSLLAGGWTFLETRPFQRFARGYVTARDHGSTIAVHLGLRARWLHATGLLLWLALPLLTGFLVGSGIGLLLALVSVCGLAPYGPWAWRAAREDDRLLVDTLEAAAGAPAASWRFVPRPRFQPPQLVGRALWE
jgi:hypothetical protein